MKKAPDPRREPRLSNLVERFAARTRRDKSSTHLVKQSKPLHQSVLLRGSTVTLNRDKSGGVRHLCIDPSPEWQRHEKRTPTVVTDTGRGAIVSELNGD